MLASFLDRHFSLRQPVSLGFYLDQQYLESSEKMLKKNYSDYFNSFKFIAVEDEPLMKRNQVMTVTGFAGLFLCLGILINLRIFAILSRRKNVAIIDKLLMSNTIISIVCHPIVLAYYIASNILFPMSDYIGTVGCLISVHFLDVFVRFYNF